MPEAKKTGEVIFFSKSAKCQLANFVPEKWDGGRVIQSEQSLEFSNNLYIAKTKKEINFIKGSKAFKMSHIEECKDMDEWSAKMAARQMRKSIKTVESESVTEVIPDKKRPRDKFVSVNSTGQ